MNMHSELRSAYIYEGIDYMSLFYVPLSPRAPVPNGYSYGFELAINRFVGGAKRCLNCPSCAEGGVFERVLTR